MKTIITVLGMVQGIGFRPFVARLAESMQLSGTVRNSGGIVIITCDAKTGVLGEFVRRLRFQSPRGTRILDIRVSQCAGEVEEGFRIIASDGDAGGNVPILPPDIGLCPDCRAELTDPRNRRYRYPYISCTLCGPRYSIMEQLPYDRGHITMKHYPMCTQCSTEYQEKGNRRRHAQTISCHDCGPQLILTEKTEVAEAEQAIRRSIRILQHGGVLALKGVGGYQLCCSVSAPEAVHRIRELKQREKKPFAVMFADIRQVREYCEVSDAEQALLESAAAPIVLLHRKQSFDRAVCGESREIGAFLPYTGIHELLLTACGPLVMTSANITSEPIITSDRRMRELADSEAGRMCIDAVAWNTREILRPLDDSLCRVVEGEPVFLRRSRGYVPLPLLIGQSKPVLACGGDLKATFALTAADRVYMSQYFGDLEHYSVETVYKQSIPDMEQLFGIKPAQIVCDLHPGYHSHQFAQQEAACLQLPLLQVQHHHAHIASVMAEHDLQHCIGVAMDGTGYGTDGAVWGGEFLLCTGTSFRRMGHLEYCELLGGDTAAKDAALTAAVQLLQLLQRELPDKAAQTSATVIGQRIASLLEKDGNTGKVNMVSAALQHHINTGKSSSMGRLFDTASALLGIRDRNHYEGECAIALENAAAAWAEQNGQQAIAAVQGLLHFPVTQCCEDGEDMLIAGRFDLLSQLLSLILTQPGAPETKARTKRAPDQNAAVRQGEAAYAFHAAVAQLILEMAERIREKTGENQVALSGGVFANMILWKQTVERLRQHGFTVFWNQSVPSNDGGIALGQAWLACHDRKK